MIYDAKRDLIWLLLRPWVWIPRVLYITFTIILFIIRFLLLNGSNDIRLQKKLAIYLLNTITKLGPCFIKLGQALSTRPDLVKQIWLDELIKLQDDLPPFEHQLALDIFQEEIGKTVQDAFEYFPSESVASASLGQVYKAKLKNNSWVAVKIQRPNLITLIRQDIVIIRILSILSSSFLPLNLGFGIHELIDEFGSSLFKEIDYKLEAENAERFAENFNNEPTVIVPKVEKMFSSRRVITTRWIDGTKLKDRNALIKNGIDPTSIIRTAVISGIQQLLEFGYFHADPHPGNLFALKGQDKGRGNLGYIDFGMMDSINDTDRITLTSAIVHLVNKDYLSLAKDFQKLGFLSDKQDLKEIAEILCLVLGEVITKDVNSLNLKSITDKFSDLMFDYPFRVPAKFALIIRAVVSQEGLALKLDPKFKIIRFAYPYIAKRLLTEENEELIAILMEIIFDENNTIRVDRLEGLLEAIDDASNTPGSELIPVAGNGIKLLISPKGSGIRRKLLLSLIKNDEFNPKEMRDLIKLIFKKFDPISVSSQLLRKISPIFA